MHDWKHEIRQRLAKLNLAPAREAAIVEELAQHLDDYYAELLASGVTGAEAERRTLVELSESEFLARELWRVERQVAPEPIVLGTNRRKNMLADLWQDLRFGVRMLAKNPGFTLIAVLTLGLGIGANTAIFSLVNATLLRTLAVKDPQQLVVFTTAGPQPDDNSYSYRQIERFQQNSRSLTGLIIAGGLERLRMTEADSTGQVGAVQTTRVSGNFFTLLGVNTVAGRTLTEADDNAANPQPVAVISYQFWKNRFDLDPGVVGRKITLNDFPFIIVGVAPPGFYGFDVGYAPDVWWPLQMTPQVMPDDNRLRRGAEWLRVMARLKPDAQLEQARAEMDVVFQQSINEISPEQAAGFTPTQRRNYFERRIRLDAAATGLVRNHLRRTITKPLLVLMVMAGLVLLIACANVANLMLVRAAGRRKEIAVRLSLGAGRFRLVRQLLTESLLLAALSGVLGLLLARWGASLLLAYLPRQSAVTLDPALDTQVFGFTLAVTLATGTLFGLAPALRATRFDLVSSLKDNAGASAGRARLALHNVLVVAQVALSLFLLIGAGLFVRSLQNLKNLDAGFDRENVVLFGLDTGRGYTPAQRVTLQRQVLERLEALPGARAASLSHLALLSGGRITNNVTVEGHAPRPDEDVKCHQLRVGPKFFTAMGIPLLQGRDFNTQELQPLAQLPNDQSATAQAPQPQLSVPLSATPVAVINQTMARYFFGEKNPIGQHFRLREGTFKDIPIEVIGIAKDAKYEDLREPTRRIFYLSYFQWPHETRLFAEQRILLRTVGEPSNTIAAIQRTVRELDPQLQVQDQQTMNAVVDEALTQERFIAQLGGFFSLCALLLACLGLYGVMSYATARRTQEIGIRIALGAQGADVLRLFIKQGMTLVLLGMALGLLGASALTRLMKSLLFGVSVYDPPTFVGVSLLLLLIALLACWVPARRATKVDPMIALRSE
jgi:predicted permease